MGVDGGEYKHLTDCLSGRPSVEECYEKNDPAWINVEESVRLSLEKRTNKSSPRVGYKILASSKKSRFAVTVARKSNLKEENLRADSDSGAPT